MNAVSGNHLLNSGPFRVYLNAFLAFSRTHWRLFHAAFSLRYSCVLQWPDGRA